MKIHATVNYYSFLGFAALWFESEDVKPDQIRFTIPHNPDVAIIDRRELSIKGMRQALEANDFSRLVEYYLNNEALLEIVHGEGNSVTVILTDLTEDSENPTHRMVVKVGITNGSELFIPSDSYPLYQIGLLNEKNSDDEELYSLIAVYKQKQENIQGGVS